MNQKKKLEKEKKTNKQKKKRGKGAMEYFAQMLDSYFLIKFSMSTNYEIHNTMHFCFPLLHRSPSPAAYQFSNLRKYFRISCKLIPGEKKTYCKLLMPDLGH